MVDNSIYTGIVVQNNDPEKAGRVKVFVPGITNTVYDGWNGDVGIDKEFSFIDGSILPILDQLREDLPWADCATTLFGGDSSQIMIGGTPTTLTQPAGQFSIPSVGSHVNIFFRRGNINFPTYFSASHGSDEWSTAIGDDYPTDGTDTNVHVINSSKHGFRFVDTADREEIILKHFSGSLAQMILKDSNWNTVENKTETIGLDSTTTINGNEISTTFKNKTVDIIGSETLSITGDETINITGNQTIGVGGAENITIGGGQSINVTGDVTIRASGTITIESAGGKIVLSAAGVKITGAVIDLN